MFCVTGTGTREKIKQNWKTNKQKGTHKNDDIFQTLGLTDVQFSFGKKIV